MSVLTDLQHDAVTEMLNIAVGRAASALNELVDEEVTLSVPRVDFITRTEAGQMIDERAADSVCAVAQEFAGQFSGNALLIFPEAKSLSLVRMMIGDQVPLEAMTELEQEALTEVGNIVLNASLGTIANLLDMQFESSLPMFLKGTGLGILGVEDGQAEAGDLALLVEVDFQLKNSDISGYVLFMLDVVSAQKFGELLDAYLKKLAG